MDQDNKRHEELNSQSDNDSRGYRPIKKSFWQKIREESKREQTLKEKIRNGVLTFLLIFIVFPALVTSCNNKNKETINTNQSTQNQTKPQEPKKEEFQKNEFNLGEVYEKDSYTLKIANPRVVKSNFGTGTKYKIVDMEVVAKQEHYLGFDVKGITEDNAVVDRRCIISVDEPFKDFPMSEKVQPGLKLKGQLAFEIKDEEIKKIRITEDSKDIFYNL